MIDRIPFTYELPEDRIAQRPVHPPDSAKLLVYDRSSNGISDSTFADIGTLFRPGDLLVFNDSKVITSRLFGNLPGGGEAEVMLLQRREPGIWSALGKPLKKFRPGIHIAVAPDVSIEVLERIGSQEVLVRIHAKQSDVDHAVLAHGHMPIPPYIRSGKSDEQDVVDYQSIFASTEGSVAAPTASLHFTRLLMKQLSAMGVDQTTVTLHVGAASFLALWEQGEDAPSRKPGKEQLVFQKDVANKINETRQKGGRVIAVGTTVVRALESMMYLDQEVEDGSLLETELFITPGHKFRSIDVMITNFHQPRTTHLLLVEAFMGRQGLSRTYGHALDAGYRFLSYGDGMIVV